MAGLHQSWFRVATYNFLAAALAVGLTLTKKYNIPVEQGGGRTKDSAWDLLDLGKLNLKHAQALQYVDSLVNLHTKINLRATENNALFQYFGNKTSACVHTRMPNAPIQNLIHH